MNRGRGGKLFSVGQTNKTLGLVRMHPLAEEEEDTAK